MTKNLLLLSKLALSKEILIRIAVPKISNKGFANICKFASFCFFMLNILVTITKHENRLIFIHTSTLFLLAQQAELGWISILEITLNSVSWNWEGLVGYWIIGKLE